ncbi:MAG: hydroxymethylglutaryl-CoA lyase [Pseudobdellovibrionaceae bacterium]
MAGKVTIVEVGLRDGLQNEAQILEASIRIEFARKLAVAGLKRIELGAFVHPDWVPQMAHSGLLFDKAHEMQKEKTFPKGVRFSGLVPNEKGMNDALKYRSEEIAIFAACSESFSKKNINCTIEESFERFKPVVALAKKNKVKVRGYLSTCFGCPYEGRVSVKQVAKVTEMMAAMGVFEISIGDTIGVANPKQVRDILKVLNKIVPAKKLAGHFHDTRGTALVNIYEALDQGLTTFDSSLGGLGGCPYAPGALGNVATEDVVYMLDGLGIKTGVDIEKLIELNQWISSKMNRTLPSRVGKAGLLKPKGPIL